MAITNLYELLKNLQPILDSEAYVFCMVDGELKDFLEFNPIATFLEKEGLTLVLTQSQANHLGQKYDSLFKKITLSVYSSLEAVGLTAAISNALAQNDISANVIAAYNHDHVFVPIDKSEQALQILLNLTEQLEVEAEEDK